MSITTAFRDWLDDQSIATSGQDLFIGDAPTGRNAPDEVWWLIPNGGSQQSRNITGEVFSRRSILIRRRGIDGSQVENDLTDLADLVSADGCLELSGYTLAKPPEVDGPYVDSDLDNERLKVGQVQLSITVYT